jgi:hypothetical protein
MANDLIKFDNKKNIEEFLQQPATKMAEFLTGLLASDPTHVKLSAGRLVQASIKWKLFTQLGKEVQEYIAKGKIKGDFLNELQNEQALCELLEFIDECAPDEERFKAMKSLFLRSIFAENAGDDQILAWQFMKLCKQLDSGDLLILKAAFDIYHRRISKKVCPDPSKFAIGDNLAHNWLVAIAHQIGHGIEPLVEVNEEKLIRLKLIGPKVSDLRFSDANKFRLTDLGFKLCEFIYDFKPND